MRKRLAQGIPHMLVVYERISTDSGRQSADLQHDALVAAGVDVRHIYGDKLSGSRDDRPGLKDCLAFLKPGDTLVVWKLDRLGRSLSHLLATVTELQGRGGRVPITHRGNGYDHGAGQVVVLGFRRFGGVRTIADPGAGQSWACCRCQARSSREPRYAICCPKQWPSVAEPSNMSSARSNHGWGSTHFLTRTLKNVRTEMSLSVLACNMKRMIRMMGVPALLEAIRT
jgi:hypothetical protein